jgi:release factor glutamine methyltransferase
MIIKQLLAKGSELILKSQSTSPLLDAEVLLSFALKKPKEHLYTYPEKSVNASLAKKYLALAKKRAAGMPVAYLTNTKEFFGLSFYVNRDVLIPRLKTEILVYKAAVDLKHAPPLNIVDVGTGSGCIIISLYKALGNKHKYFAADVSVKALKVASLNARKHKTKITFKKSNLLSAFNRPFDVVIANLPYLAKETDPSTKYDPKIALLSDKQGLGHYERLFKQMQKYPAKVVYAEVDPPQERRLKALGKKLIPNTQLVVVSDI